MRRFGSVVTIAVVMTALALAGCGPSQEEVKAAAQQEALASIDEAKAALDAKREELAELRAQLRELTEAEAVEEDLAELQSRVAEMEEATVDMADEFNTKLVDFINADPPLEGEPPTESQLKVIRLKSEEDLILAGEHIDKGGDYRRAIDIYEAALRVDPDNERLLEALAAAEDNRYLSQERFAQVQKGMTRDQVRGALGQVNLRNIREYPERDVIAWFYPTNESGDAAAVWFRKGKGGKYTAYQLKYDAVTREGTQEP